MTTTIEPLKRSHLDSPALQLLLRGIPPEYILPLETSGGMAQAILHDGEAVGVLTVTLEREAMIAVHPKHHRKGIASVALGLAKPLAIGRSITWVVATALIGRASSSLLVKLGAVETRRTNREVFYRVDFTEA